MGDKVQVLLGGKRAKRGRRPKVVLRYRHKVYYLSVPGLRLVLTWSPWHGYGCDAMTVLAGGRVVSTVYFT